MTTSQILHGLVDFGLCHIGALVTSLSPLSLTHPPSWGLWPRWRLNIKNCTNIQRHIAHCAHTHTPLLAGSVQIAGRDTEIDEAESVSGSTQRAVQPTRPRPHRALLDLEVGSHFLYLCVSLSRRHSSSVWQVSVSIMLVRVRGRGSIQ